jgi:molecular chaperone IbpA
VKVVGASLVNGLLTIELKREVPEDMKPRRIAIARGEALPKVEARLVETEKLAA